MLKNTSKVNINTIIVNAILTSLQIYNTKGAFDRPKFSIENILLNNFLVYEVIDWINFP